MSKAAVFKIELEPGLHAEFMAAAEASHRPASQVVSELMRDFVQRQQDRQDHAALLRDKVDAARSSIEAGLGRSNELVEAEFAARRARIASQT